MSWSIRRASLVLLAVAALLGAALLQPAQAQKGKGVRVKGGDIVVGVDPAPGPGPGPGPALKEDRSGFDFDALTLPRDGVLKGKIEAAAQYVESENWEVAIKALQALVDLDYDVFADLPRVGVNGRVGFVWVSVQSEADRLLGSLPKDGKNFYRAKYDGPALEMLKEAKQSRSVDKLKQVVRRYRHTNPGLEAATLLAGVFLDRGQYAEAAREFDTILDVEGWDKVEPIVLVKAAIAFREAANRTRDNQRLLGKESAAWAELNKRSVGSVRLGGQNRKPSDIQDFLAKLPAEQEGGEGDFPMTGGNVSRSAQLVGGPAYLEEKWKQPMVRKDATKAKLNQALKAITDRGQPILTPYQPIALVANIKGEKVPLTIFRNYSGLVAVRMKNGKMEWESPSAWSLDRMASDNKGGRMAALEAFWSFFVTGNSPNGYSSPRPQVVVENSAVGALSSDGRLVYAVDDLQMPPPPDIKYDPQWGGPNPNGPSYQQEVKDAILSSKLQAVVAGSGKVAWELGGKDDKNGLNETYFLGPPLPFEGKLYVLTEKKKKLRLLCLEPYTEPDPKEEGKINDKVRIVSTQELATVKYGMEEDVLRRSQASHLAYGEGVLVCPTNAGALLAFNLRTNRLMWAYSYRSRTDGPEEWDIGMGRNRPLPPGWIHMPDGTARPLMVSANQQWKVAPPVVADGKVVFTAPDSATLTCLNLKDGTRLWSRNRTEDELYMGGVYDGKVVVVGKKNTRGLSLQTGEVLFTVEAGMPSGMGVCSENVYYLPLEKSIQHKEPGIAAIDLSRGLLIGATRSRKNEKPGNLVFFDDSVLSQTPLEVAAYPQLKAHLEEIDKAIAAKPDDLDLLYERGNLRLDKGDMLGSVEDLRKVLSKTPAKPLEDKAKDKLYVTLTEFLLRDFSRAETYLKEYEDLCKLDVDKLPVEQQEVARQEERRRKVKLLCLVARGKENQGRLAEAFDKYQECGSLIDSKELFSVVDEPTVKAAVDVLSQGRIVAMMAAATAEDRKPLEDRIEKRWEELKKSSDLTELRKFVAVFGSSFEVGKEARLKLAERLMAEPGGDSLIEAERHLSLLRGRDQTPELKARAVEALARLNERKGLMEDAAYYYRLLARDYPRTPVRDGKTGEELLNDLATDKRFLPYLDEPARAFKVGKVLSAPDATQGNFGQPQRVYYFDQQGEGLPFFRRHQLGLNLDSNTLKLVDRYNNEERWSEALKQTNFATVSASPTADGPKFAYQTLGHLVVLPVGNRVFGVDPVNKRVIWDFDLNAQPGAEPRLARDSDGSIQMLYGDGWKQRLGSTGPLDGNAICVQTREGLTALDPVDGRVLWRRSDVGPRNHIFGDDKYIFVVDVDEKGVAGATRALRAHDGVAVKLPDFSAQYQRKVRVQGRYLLFADVDGPRVTAALYDVLTGKNVWSHAFAAGSMLLKTEDPDLVGAVETSGKLHVVSISEKKEILQTAIDGKIFTAKVSSVALLRDANFFYVAINAPPSDPEIAPNAIQANVRTDLGMRAVPVNGPLYAFKPDGSLVWKLDEGNDVKHQMLVLDQFQESPVLWFTARYQKQPNRFTGQPGIFVAAAAAYEKRSGKVLFHNEQLGQVGQNFFKVERDPAKRRIELVSPQLKISLPYELPKEGDKK